MLQELNNFYSVLTCTQFTAAQIHNFHILSHFIFLSNLFAEHLEMLRGAVWEYLICSMSFVIYF